MTNITVTKTIKTGDNTELNQQLDLKLHNLQKLIDFYETDGRKAHIDVVADTHNEPPHIAINVSSDNLSFKDLLNDKIMTTVGVF